MACAGIGAALAGAGSEEAFGTALASELAGGSATVGPEAFLGASGAGGAASLAGGEGGTSFGGPEAPASSVVENGGPQWTSEDSILDFAAPTATPLGAQPAGGPGFSWPTLSQIGAGGNIASALYGMDQASAMKKLALMQANKSTPWQSAGGGDLAAQQLMALISGKTDVSTLPGYAAGKQAVERSGAANGWLGSGNMMAALQKFGGDFYNNAVSQLSGLAGAQFNPVSGGSLALGGARDSAALNLAAMSQINKSATAIGA